MTRITSFGRKRTYLESETDSGFLKSPDDAPVPKEPTDEKKKRPKVSHTEDKDTEGKDLEAGISSQDATDAKKRKKRDRRSSKSTPSETRRQKRISERLSDTICFACRERGHAARDCPTTKNNGKSVGICYRCGSNRHTLSRCKKPIDSMNPLPFASCFVCSKKGHLASACPENTERGVYPNGGCCKLCGETSHLAKDCKLRRQDIVAPSSIMGIGEQALGADEDDFHAFKRRKTAIEMGEKNQLKTFRTVVGKVGVNSGVKVPGPSTVAKKIVTF